MYRELAKQVIPRTVEELRARLAAKGKRKTAVAGASAAAKAQRTPREELDTEHRANLREFTRQAHLVNLDLGTALLKDLTVSPDDANVARFFAWGLLGPQSAGYLGTSDHTARTIAANGVRLVVEEHRTTTTPRLKSGKPGKTKVAYGEVDDAAKWLWKFVAGAKTAAEIYSRALVVFAAQHYASQLVLPTSQRRGSVLPSSHKDTARKAFEQITKDVLPASYLPLQRAIAAEARSYHKQADALTAAARTKPRRGGRHDRRAAGPRGRGAGGARRGPRGRGVPAGGPRRRRLGRRARRHRRLTPVHPRGAGSGPVVHPQPAPSTLTGADHAISAVPVTTVPGFPEYPIVAEVRDGPPTFTIIGWPARETEAMRHHVERLLGPHYPSRRSPSTSARSPPAAPSPARSRAPSTSTTPTESGQRR